MPVGFPDYYGGLTLPVTVEEGGTGQTSVTSKALLYGAGTSKLIETNVGTSGQYLQIDPITLDPTFANLVVDVSTITGILPIANGGTGTATPALVAGSNIVITGSWPNQTIALNANPNVTTITATGATIDNSAVGDATIIVNSANPNIASIQLQRGGILDAELFDNGNSGTVGFNAPQTYGFQIGFIGDTNQSVKITKVSTGVVSIAADMSSASGYGNDLILSGGSTTIYPAGLLLLRGGATTGSGTPSSVKIQKSDGSIDYLTVADSDGSVSLYSPLPIASGGTGTATPALVAGTSISITGSWPDQTINNTGAYASLADPLPVAHGGTGQTSADPLTLGSIQLNSGTNPNIVFSATVGTGHMEMDGFANIRAPQDSVAGGDWHVLDRFGNNALQVHLDGATSIALHVPLAVASGGTGTATPGLVAGTGITITGTWPDQTITNSAPATLPETKATVDLTAQTATIGSTTLLTAAGGKLYRITYHILLRNVSSTATISYSIAWTQDGKTWTHSGGTALYTSGTDAIIEFQTDVFPDASTNVTYGINFTQGGVSDNFDIHARAVEM